MTRESALPSKVLVSGGAAVVVLGVWGYARVDPSEPVLGLLYRTMQLFVLETGDVEGPLPWQLEVARFGAAVITTASIVFAVILLSRGRLDRWRARRARDHVIVCGLGRRGAPAALALAREGRTVVAVESDSERQAVGLCRRAGVPVIIGDGRQPDVLERAGVARAAHLVILVSDIDVSGAMVLAAIHANEARRDGTLGIHLEIDDPRVATLYRAVNLSAHRDPAWHLDELDLAAAAGTVMVDELPPWGPETAEPHVVVIGATALGIAVVRELGRRSLHRPGRSVLVTVVDPDPAAPVPRSFEHVDVQLVPHLDRLADTCTAAYVCLDDETSALVAAIELVGRRPDLPTLVRAEHGTALADLLARGMPALHCVSVDDRILTSATLLHTTEEQLARALHEYYRSTIATVGDASAVPWSRLADDLRSSNRAQAAHIARKLEAVGCTIVADDGAPPERLTDAEIELLAELEHQRWNDERLAAGWKLGPRDPDARSSPDLVPWSELGEDRRDIDRRFVRALPDVLAGVGLRLSRRHG